MQPRMNHPAMTLPGVFQALTDLSKATHKADLPPQTVDMVHLRASQINGCSLCVDLHAREMKHHGASDQRVFAVAAWREAPFYTEAERAALALTEAVTRIADRGDAVPDELWAEAAGHYDELQLSALLVAIASVNVWNRLNAATRQIAGSYT